jgi:hypothetical protein
VGTKINPQGSIRMPDWIARANIGHFKKLLETETKPDKRRVIERELAEEELKLAALKKQSEERGVREISHSRQCVGRTLTGSLVVTSIQPRRMRRHGNTRA